MPSLHDQGRIYVPCVCSVGFHGGISLSSMSRNIVSSGLEGSGPEGSGLEGSGSVMVQAADCWRACRCNVPPSGCDV